MVVVIDAVIIVVVVIIVRMIVAMAIIFETLIVRVVVVAVGNTDVVPVVVPTAPAQHPVFGPSPRQAVQTQSLGR